MCPAQERNAVLWPGLEPGPFDGTTSPRWLELIVITWKRPFQWAYCREGLLLDFGFVNYLEEILRLKNYRFIRVYFSNQTLYIRRLVIGRRFSFLFFPASRGSVPHSVSSANTKEKRPLLAGKFFRVCMYTWGGGGGGGGACYWNNIWAELFGKVYYRNLTVLRFGWGGCQISVKIIVNR